MKPVMPANVANNSRPKLPERENGRRRYTVLLDAAERLLMRDGPATLTIKRLAHEAGVPAASVYHFFPTPAAISIGLSERYLAAFVDLVGRPIAGIEGLSWQQIVETLMFRAVAYYTDHPYAQRLVLGSDHSAQIRNADFENNRLLAGLVASLLTPHFPDVPPDQLGRATLVGITIGDAILTLSIQDLGEITPAYGHEAVTAICGYLTARFGSASTRVD